MTRAFIGGLSLEIPNGWDDHTIVTLVSPPLEAQKLIRAKPAAEERLSIVMKREAIPGAPPPMDTFAEAQEELMARLMPGSRVDAKGQVTIGTGEAALEAMTREFVIPNTPNGELRQIQIYFFVGRSFFVLAGTAPNDKRFESARKEFLRVASGIRIESRG
jgi:hypothetical protein